MWFVAIFVVLLCYLVLLLFGEPRSLKQCRGRQPASLLGILGLSVFLLHTPEHISPTSVCTSTPKLKTKICQRLNTGTQTHEVCSVYVQAWRAGDCFVLHKGHSCNSSGNKTVSSQRLRSQRLHSHMDACCPGRAIFPLHTPASSGQILCQIHPPPPQFFHRGRFMSQQPLLDVQKFSTNQPQTLIHANPKPQAGNREPYTRSYSPNSKDKQCIQQPCCQVALRPETGCRALSLGSAWHTDWQGHFKVKGLGSWVWTFVVGCGIKGHCVEGLACVCGRSLLVAAKLIRLLYTTHENIHQLDFPLASASTTCPSCISSFLGTSEGIY